MATHYRRYPDKDLKILWGLSAARCAFPECKQLCVVEATKEDPTAVIGKIAHIHAHSDGGPRANPQLIPQERDSYDNWLLLCSTHHDLIDRQPNTYTAPQLQSWKTQHEQWVRSRLTQEIPQVSFAELEIVTRAILRSPLSPSTQFTVTSPLEKMLKNRLSETTNFYLRLGYGMALDVQEFVEHVALRDPDFPERLKAGFVHEYQQRRVDGFDGDALFEVLRGFAAPSTRSFKEQAASLGVIAYLFQKCEIFEP